MNNSENTNTGSGSGNYGKRPVWQWIGIYVVIAAVVYGLVYYFFLAKGSGFGSGQGGQNIPSVSQQPQISPEMSPVITPGSDQQAENTITLTADGFSPLSLTIKTGTTVIWVNNSGSDATVNSDPHPIHTDYPPLNLGSFPDGGTLTLTFDKPGTYGYHNHLNPSQKGTVIVQ